MNRNAGSKKEYGKHYRDPLEPRSCSQVKRDRSYDDSRNDEPIGLCTHYPRYAQYKCKYNGWPPE